MVLKLGTAGTAEQREVQVSRVHMRMQLCTPVLLRPPQEGPLAALCCLWYTLSMECMRHPQRQPGTALSRQC